MLLGVVDLEFVEAPPSGLHHTRREGANEVLRSHVHVKGAVLVVHFQSGEVAEDLVRGGVGPDPILVLYYATLSETNALIFLLASSSGGLLRSGGDDGALVVGVWNYYLNSHLGEKKN